LPLRVTPHWRDEQETLDSEDLFPAAQGQEFTFAALTACPLCEELPPSGPWPRMTAKTRLRPFAGELTNGRRWRILRCAFDRSSSETSPSIHDGFLPNCAVGGIATASRHRFALDAVGAPSYR
jgi:hypothetical protein